MILVVLANGSGIATSWAATVLPSAASTIIQPSQRLFETAPVLWATFVPAGSSLTSMALSSHASKCSIMAFAGIFRSDGARVNLLQQVDHFAGR